MRSRPFLRGDLIRIQRKMMENQTEENMDMTWKLYDN